MAYCPNCGTTIEATAADCPGCWAEFGPETAWQPLETKPTGSLAPTTSRPRPAAPKPNHKAPNPGKPPKPRPPYFGMLGLAVPWMFMVSLNVYDRFHKTTMSSGGWGMGEVFLGAVFVLAGFVLGAAFTIIAIASGEEGKPFQIIGAIVNFGALFLLLGLIL